MQAVAQTIGKSKKQGRGAWAKGELGRAVRTKESIEGSWESKVQRLFIGWAATASGCTVVEWRDLFFFLLESRGTFVLEMGAVALPIWSN